MSREEVRRLVREAKQELRQAGASTDATALWARALRMYDEPRGTTPRDLDELQWLSIACDEEAE